jgi:ubiquitin carboxyl-terminal hydrolase 5/13
MGFPLVRCEKALHATGNSDAEMAAAWLFEHMDDADIDEPMQQATGSASAAATAIDPESIESLGNMGFSAPQARQALKETGGDMERAVDWLFSHPDAVGDFGDDDGMAGAGGDAGADAGDAGGSGKAEAFVGGEPLDDAPAQFQLKSIVCHKGASIHAGHYVAFVRREGALPEQPAAEGTGGADGDKAEEKQKLEITSAGGSAGAEWVLYNDEKVALGGDVEEMKKFAYIYFLRRV